MSASLSCQTAGKPSGVPISGETQRAMADSKEIAIGIDLGTTNCCVAVMLNGQVETIPNESGFPTTPSYIAFGQGEIISGQQAKDDSHSSPQNTIFAVKRIIGLRFSDAEVTENQGRWPFRLVADDDGFAAVQLETGCMPRAVWKPQEISAELLKHLKKTAEDFLGLPVQRAVITVPANFTENQRRATYQAGQLAGLEVIGIINEPTAAAVAYGLQTMDSQTSGKTILVCDFGGGTLDVSIIEAIGREDFRVVSTAGNMHLGGEDFDQKILDHLILEFEKENGPGIRGSPPSMAVLRKYTEAAKHLLSHGTTDKANISIKSLFDKKDFKTTLTRSTFEKVCHALFDRLLEPIETALRKAQMSRIDVHHVVLVGGSSRIPKFREIIQNYFPGQPVCYDIHPDQAIAMGAAAMAQSAGQIRIAEVTALSLGTAVADGSFTVILPQHSPIPASATKFFTTAAHFATQVVIKVYEGEHPIADQNHLWGTLQMTGIQPDLMGVPSIAITYAYDKCGLLTVTAVERGTSNQANTDFSLKKV